MKFCEIKMDIRAINYVEEKIDDGLSLSSRISNAVELSKGCVSTFFPNEISPTNLYNFRSGGKLPESKKETWIKVNNGIMKPISNTNAFLVNMIREYLQKAKDNICIFENIIASKSDPWLESKKDNLFFYKDEVYHVVSSKNLSTKYIDQAIHYANSIYHFLGVMSSLPIENQEATENNELSDIEWDIIVRNLKKIIVGAYDGEGYLIWKRA